MNSNRQRRPSQNSTARRWVRLLFWVAVGVGMAFAYLNILPYTQAARFLLGKSADTGFARLIGMLPLIGWIANSIGTGIHWIIGAFVWALLQMVELFPIILKYDHKFMGSVIRDAESASRFEIREDDPPSLQALKRWYNKFPYVTFERALIYAAVAYLIDFCISFFTYTPIKGSLFDFGFIVLSGQFDQLDWGNLATLVTTMFVVEVIVVILLWLDRITYYMKIAHGNTAQYRDR